MSLSSRKLILAGLASTAILGLSACSQEPEFDTTASDTYIGCLESSPATEAGELDFKVVKNSDKIEINIQVNSDAFHIMSGSHVDHLLRCLALNDFGIVYEPNPSQQSSTGETTFSESGVVSNYEIYYTYHEVIASDGSGKVVVTFSPILTDSSDS